METELNIAIYYAYGNEEKTKVIINEKDIRNEFEYKLKNLLKKYE